MAAVKGVNRTKLDTPIGANVIDAGYNKGGVNVMFDTYAASALAAGSTIAVGDLLPVGAVITDINLAFDALGASSTLAVGDSATAARYVTAQSSASAGYLRANVTAGVGYKVGTNAGDNQVLITTAGAAITGNISIAIEYSL